MGEKQRNGETLYEHHLEQLALHLLQTRYNEETARNILAQKPQVDDSKEKGKSRWENSSVRFYNTTNRKRPPDLSTLGECCLTRHLRKDYSLIETMLGDNF